VTRPGDAAAAPTGRRPRRFGMLTDRFRVPWMVVVVPSEPTN
jgi:uncharacterized glyoxalase superfamily protein PhnB